MTVYLKKLQRALNLIEQGFVVLPIDSKEKACFEKGWTSWTTKESKAYFSKLKERIENRQENEFIKKPQFGRLMSEHHFCIDFDLENELALQFWDEHKNRFDDCYQEITPNGIHIEFYSPKDSPIKSIVAKNTAKGKQIGIEILAKGRLIVTYPSEFSKSAPYSFVDPTGKPTLKERIKVIDPETLKLIHTFIDTHAKGGINIAALDDSTNKPLKDSGLKESNKNHPSLEKIKKALKAVIPEEREVWLQGGMALHHFATVEKQLPADKAFKLFHNWSKLADTYKSKQDCQTRWDSFKPNEKSSTITINTLFQLAKDHADFTPQDLIEPLKPEDYMPLLDDLTPEQVTPQDLHRQKIALTTHSKSSLPYGIDESATLPPDFYFNCPSVIGHLTHLLCGQAQRPLPGSIFAALTTLCGHIKSESFSWDEEGISPIAYFVCVAGSSSGKNYPQTVVDKLVKELEIPGYANEFRTELSTYRALETSSRYFMLDEMEDMLKSVTADNVESYKRGIPSLLTKIWSKTNSTYNIPQTANAKKDDGFYLTNPKLSLCGFSQHSILECFSNEYFIHRGFTQRFLYIIEPRFVEADLARPFTVDLLPQVLEYFKQVKSTYTSPELDFKTRPTIPDSAHDVFHDFFLEIEAIKKKAALANDTLTEKIYGKAVEYAKRLALCLCDTDMLVSEALAKWCCDFMRHQLKLATEIYFKVEDRSGSSESDSMIEKIIRAWKKQFEKSEDGTVSLAQLRRYARSKDRRGFGFKYYFQEAQELGIFTVKSQGDRADRVRKVVILNRSQI